MLIYSFKVFIVFALPKELFHEKKKGLKRAKIGHKGMLDALNKAARLKFFLLALIVSFTAPPAVIVFGERFGSRKT